MAKFRTRFFELLSEKEIRTGKRYSMTAVAEELGISRVTLYKYAHETMTAVDAGTLDSFLNFFGLGPDEIDRFLILSDDPQLNAQEGYSTGVVTALAG